MPDRKIIASLVLFWAMIVGQPKAAQIDELEVSEQRGVYRVSFDVLLNADTTRARSLMMDPANWADLSEIIRLSRVLSVDPRGIQRVQMVFRGCVWFFCRTVQRIEDVAALSESEVVADALPHLSDFKFARERWRILSENDKTRVQYHAELTPDFLIPPLIGPWMIKSKIRKVLTDAAHHIEQTAAPDNTPLDTD